LCKERPLPDKHALRSTSGAAMGGGFGNYMIKFAEFAVLASISGRTPFTRAEKPDMEISKWFKGVRRVSFVSAKANCLETGNGRGKFWNAARGKGAGCVPIQRFSTLLKQLKKPTDLAWTGGMWQRPGFEKDWAGNASKEWDALRKNSSVDFVDARSCALRQFLGRPNAQLQERLSVYLSDLSPGDVLVGVHVRYGDVAIMSEQKKGGAKLFHAPGRDGRCERKCDDRRLSMNWTAASQLVSDLTADLQTQGLRVRVFVASDAAAGMAEATKLWGPQMLRGIKKDRPGSHSSLWKAGKSAEQAGELVSDWYMLGLSDVLLKMSDSTFSKSSALLGMHGPCYFRSSDPYSSEGARSCARSVFAAGTL